MVYITSHKQLKNNTALLAHFIKIRILSGLSWGHNLEMVIIHKTGDNQTKI